MNIAFVGTGYVGLVSGACFADFGQHVVCVDSNAERIEKLRAGDVPFFEPGLTELVSRNSASGRLSFTTDIADAVRGAAVVFLAVGTPEGSNGAADLSQVETATRQIAEHADGYLVLVTKSTVPVGTGATLAQIIGRHASPAATIDLASNPEFLREGSAISDFMRPNRVVIGTESERATELMKDIYRPLYLIETPVLVTDIQSAEMIKCASNAFLATKISFMNEVANLCDRVGADVHAVAKGMGLDKRIGSKFLHPGPGFGGSCFPKDTRALVALGQQHGVRQQVVESAIDVNTRQLRLLVQKIEDALGGLRNQRIAVLGLSFKPNTSDVREAPAIHLCRRLAEKGAEVRAFDPIAMPDAIGALADVGGAVVYAAGVDDAVTGAHAAVVMTEWNEFRNLDLQRLKRLMARPILVDARNVLDIEAVRSLEFEYLCTGREQVGKGKGRTVPA